MIYEFIKKPYGNWDINYNGKKIGELNYIIEDRCVEIWYRGAPYFKMKHIPNEKELLELCAALLLKAENPIDIRIKETIVRDQIEKEVKEMMELACLINNCDYYSYKHRVLDIVAMVRGFIMQSVTELPPGFCPRTGKKL